MSAATIPAEKDAEKRLKGSVAAAKRGSFLGRLFRRGGVKAIMRDRRGCCVVAVLVLVDKSVPLDGMVMEIEAGGALFRPASTYILDRGRSEIVLRFADREVSGRINGVSTLGYDVTFHAPLPAITVDMVVRDFGSVTARALRG
ncbi:MAG: hypothetical protein ACRC7G_00175 [Beijerinckiaceae bacterium]